MSSSIFQLAIEVALLVMKLIGVSAQKRKNLLEWAAKKMEDSGASIKMKDRWEKMYKELCDKIEQKKKDEVK